MKKTVKSAISAVMLGAIMFSCVSGAFAVNITDLGSIRYTNTSYGTISGVEITNTAGYPSTADFIVNDYQNFVKTLEQQYVARNPYFTVRYDTSRSNLDAVSKALMDDVFAYDDPATTSDLDYLYWNMKQWKISGVIYTTVTSTYAIYTFSQIYRTTADQENTVNTAVSAALQKLNVGSEGAYTKVKAVQDYILKNVSYDSALSKFTAYDALSSGLAVCQGYALLTYKMLTDLGVPVRFISGTTTQGPEGHAWNIVKVGQLWYNLDTTWDDLTTPTRYFLRNNAAFSDHIRDSSYNTAAFNASYPMSGADYNPAGVIQAITFPQNQGTLSVGDTLTLLATISPTGASNKALGWTSSDPTVASVDNTGKVTVKAAGTAVITAAATDGGGATASYTVTVRAADVPSTWAKAGVDALGTHGVIPASLKSGYQSNITRAEFTALIVNVYEYAKGSYALRDTTPFTDISSSNYNAQISKGYVLGIIAGTSASTFSPDVTLTREQCAKIISAAAGTINGTPISATVPLPFGDVAAIDDWALSYVRYAYQYALMNGTGVNFDPLGILTREQAMLIAERMIEKYRW